MTGRLCGNARSCGVRFDSPCICHERVALGAVAKVSTGRMRDADDEANAEHPDVRSRPGGSLMHSVGHAAGHQEIVMSTHEWICLCRIDLLVGEMCHLGAAGRSLTGVESNRGAVVAWTAGVCGGAATLAAVFATFTGRGWRIAVFVLAAIAACALLVLIGSAFRPAWGWLKETRRQRQQRKGQPRRVITDRWRYTSAAFEVGTLANLGQRGFSHDQYLRSAEDKPPAVRFGVFVACGLLPDDEPTPEHLRSCMRDCLAQPEFIGSDRQAGRRRCRC